MRAGRDAGRARRNLGGRRGLERHGEDESHGQKGARHGERGGIAPGGADHGPDGRPYRAGDRVRQPQPTHARADLGLGHHQRRQRDHDRRLEREGEALQRQERAQKRKGPERRASHRRDGEQRARNHQQPLLAQPVGDDAARRADGQRRRCEQPRQESRHGEGSPQGDRVSLDMMGRVRYSPNCSIVSMQSSFANLRFHNRSLTMPATPPHE